LPRRLPVFALALAFALPALALPAFAAAPAHWVGTWATAPVAEPNSHHAFAEDTTLRQTVHVSVGGSHIRVVFTNELGTDPLTLGGANVSLATTTNTPATPLTFSGHATVVIPPGAVAVSDPVALNLPALSDLTISLFLPAQTLTTLTLHSFADATGYDAAGNQLTAAALTNAHKNFYFQFLKEVDVDAPTGASIVTFGDSITDGAHSLLDANARWPDVLAQRLQANPSTHTLGVLNEGIGGNRILHDGYGPNALARFDRDVLALAGVKYLIFLEGINDIGQSESPTAPKDPVTAADLIVGLSQLSRQAHAHGIKVFGATITPYIGAGYASPAGEAMRQAVNQWIRTSTELDGVIDFDKSTSDPASPSTLSPADDSGDHLHPSDAGYKAMGNAIDLKLFTN
jgi:lysophospholipase L1-like esterase